MPAKRTLLRRGLRLKLMPEIVGWFALIEQIRADGDDQAWEDAGGRRRESLDAERELRHALGLPGHAISPCDSELASGASRPDYMRGLCAGATWDRAADLRRALLAAVDAQRATEAAELAKVLRAPARRCAKPPPNRLSGG